MKVDGELINTFVNVKKVNIIGITDSGKSSLFCLLQEIDYRSLNKLQADSGEEEIKQKDFIVSVNRAQVKISKDLKLCLNLVVTNLDDIDLCISSMTSILYETELIIIMLDISSIDSFTKAKAFVEHLPDVKDYKIILVSNKLDLDSNREISGFEIKQFKDKYPTIREIEVSLLTKENYPELLETIGTVLTEEDEGFSLNGLIKFHDPPQLVLNKGNTMNNNIYTPIKLFLLGNSTVGKTSFIKRYFQQDFGNTITTLGVDVEKTLVTISDTIYKIEVWDTAGQERLRSIPRQYYSKGDGFILMFDVTSRSTFNDVIEWIKDIRGNGRNTIDGDDNSIVILFVGNKIDSVSKREVKREEAEALAKEQNLKYAEISCKSGLNIQEVMTNLILEAYQGVKGITSSFMLQNKKKGKINKKAKCCQDN